MKKQMLYTHIKPFNNIKPLCNWDHYFVFYKWVISGWEQIVLVLNFNSKTNVKVNWYKTAVW